MSNPKALTVEKHAAGCWACGRVVARRFAVGSGKARVRHKCPHGVWCVSGSVAGIGGMNFPARYGKHYCPECVKRADNKQAQAEGTQP